MKGDEVGRAHFEGTVAILDSLRRAGAPLYAITNFAITNFASDTFAEACELYPFLKTSFLDIVVSGDERLIKPDPAIFELLLARQKLVAEDCIFIDDSPKNVDAAAALGFHALHFTTPEALRRDLTALGFAV